MSNTNYYDRLGVLVLSSRLRKISERLLLEIAAVYKAQNIDFEPGWFHILHLLSEHEEMSITEISDMLQVSHPSVIQVAKVMEKRELLHTFPGKEDKRKRIIRLTSKGSQLLKKAQPIWEKLEKAMNETLNQGKHSKNLLKAISEFETNFKKKPLKEQFTQLNPTHKK